MCSLILELPGSYLTEEDFAAVYNEIHSASRKYYQIGLILGTSPNDLDVIKKRSDGNASKALSHGC